MSLACAESSPLNPASAGAADAGSQARRHAAAPPKGCRPLLAAALAVASALCVASLYARPRAGGEPAPASGQAAPESSSGRDWGAGGRGGIRLVGEVPSVEQLYEVARGVHEDLDDRMDSSDVAKKLGWSSGTGASEEASSADIERMLQNMSSSMKEGISEMRSLEIMACMSDAWRIVADIGGIIISIRQATLACKDVKTVEERTVCTAVVSANLATWGYFAGDISAIISDCPGVFNKEAACAGASAGIFQAAATTVNAGAMLAGNCMQGIDKPPSPPKMTVIPGEVDEAIAEGRRLRTARGDGSALPDWIGNAPADTAASAPHGTALGRYAEQLVAQSRAMAVRGEALPFKNVTVDGKEIPIVAGNSLEEVSAIMEADARRSQAVATTPAPLRENQKWAIAACVFDTQAIVARFIQAAAFMGFAILDCKKDLILEIGQKQKQKCAVDVSITVLALSIAAQAIATDTLNCPHTLDEGSNAANTLCAVGILQTITSASNFAAGFAGIAGACEGLDPNFPEPNKTIKNHNTTNHSTWFPTERL